MSDFSIFILVILSPMIIPVIYLDILILCYAIKSILGGNKDE